MPSRAEAVDTTFDAPNVPEDTVVEFTLAASDGTVTVSNMTLITILDSTNSPPDVDAGDDQQLPEGSTVSLNGTVTDSDPEDVHDYTWTHNSTDLAITLADGSMLDTTFETCRGHRRRVHPGRQRRHRHGIQHDPDHHP